MPIIRTVICLLCLCVAAHAQLSAPRTGFRSVVLPDGQALATRVSSTMAFWE